MRFAVLAVLLGLLTIVLTTSVAAEDISLTYVVYEDGTIECKITVSNVENLSRVAIEVRDTLEPYTVMAVDSSGETLPVEYNGTHIVVHTLNTSGPIFVEYTLASALVMDSILVFNVSPTYRATLRLPLNATLLGVEVFTKGSTFSIDMENGAYVIKLSPGTYAISIELPFISPAPRTTTPIGAPSIPLLYFVVGLGIGAGIAVGISTVLMRRRTRISIQSSSTSSLALALDARDRDILAALAKGPMSMSELARVLGWSKSTVWRRVRRLVSQGLISSRYEGRRVILELTDLGKRVLQSQSTL